MGTRDARVDAYVQRAAPFAQPILAHLRELVHAACPQVTETIKWGFPHFEYKGVLCSMAGFNAHCAFAFWKREAAEQVDGARRQGEAMGQYGRITRLSDLPSDTTLKRVIRAAAALNEAGGSAAAKGAPRKPPPEVPDDLAAALRRNRKAQATFDAFSVTHRREYIEWIVGAKRDDTRSRRLATAIEWLAEGKTKEWRYQR